MVVLITFLAICKPLFMIKFPTTKLLFLMLTLSMNSASLAIENVTESPKGIITGPGSYLLDNINDGVLSNTWRMYINKKNTFEFTYDGNLTGITGEDGDVQDLYQISSVSLYSPNSGRAVKTFLLESQSNNGPWQRLYSDQAVSTSYNFATQAAGGHLAIAPTFVNVYDPYRVNDGSIHTAWKSRSSSHHNIFEFTFDPNLNGTPSEAADQFTLDSLSLVSSNNSLALQTFGLEAQSNSGAWQRLFSDQAPANPYNFAQRLAGGSLAVSPSHLGIYTPSRIHDSSAVMAWLSQNGAHHNIFEFSFDPNLNGTPSEVADQFTLDSIALVSSNNNQALQTFGLEAQSNNGSWQRLFSDQAPANPYNFAQRLAGGSLVVSPSHAGNNIPSRIHDSSTVMAWLSQNGAHHNIFEFSFDPNLNGTPSEAADQFTLDSIALVSSNNNQALQTFGLEAQNNNGTWQRLFSDQAPANPYNFAQRLAGGSLVVSPSHAGNNIPSRIHDSSAATSWLSLGGNHHNIFEFTFDPNLNGTPSEAADQFTLDSITIITSNNNEALKDFEITVETTTGWQASIPLTAAISANEQVFSIGPFNNVIRVRLTTLNNYGNGYMRIHELGVRGVWTGANPVFTGNQSGTEQLYDLTGVAANNDGRRDNITRVRLETMSNFGNGYLRINELGLRGVWAGANPIFTGDQSGIEQLYDLTGVVANNDGRRDNVTRVRLETMSNFGNGYLRINELGLRGVWTGANPIFTGDQSGIEQLYDLTGVVANNDGRRDNITRIRLETTANYGHGYMQIHELGIHGVWGGANPIFTAAQVSGEQSFSLAISANNDGRRDNITRLRLQTIDNFNDSSYMDIKEFQAFGIINQPLTGGFNAFDTATAAAAITGSLQTRVANNAAISFDVIALNTDKSAVDASFSKDVKVELLANMTSVALNADNCPITSTVIASLPVAAISNGRSTVTMPVANNVWKEVAVRISYQPPAGALIVTCAGDKFSIRPAAFTLVAQHGDWETAGNSQAINASTTNANPTHKAGRPFSLLLKAVDSAGSTMNNYDDVPILTNGYPALVTPAGGLLGDFNLGTLTNSNGVISSDTAHYSEVGAISLKMSDEGFAGIDAADGTSLLNRTISSAEITIGRFIPDHFKATTVNNGSFDNACNSFTYAGQPFSYLTVPELKITAYNSSSTITQNYTGNFAKLTPSDFSVTTPTSDAVVLQANNIDLISLNWNPAAPSLNDNNDGSLNFVFGADSYNHFHDANSLVAPYTNTVHLSFTAITDSDGVTTQILPHIMQASGGSVRFGQVAISNAHGSELAPLSVNINTEYFNGFDWTDNMADQCTTLALASQLQISNPETGGGGWLSGNAAMTIANGTTSGTLSNNNPLANGSAILSLSAPGEDNQGYVNIRSQIAGSYSWLLGDYNGNGIYDDEASARASFGLFKGSDTIIFRREIY